MLIVGAVGRKDALLATATHTTREEEGEVAGHLSVAWVQWRLYDKAVVGGHGHEGHNDVLHRGAHRGRVLVMFIDQATYAIAKGWLPWQTQTRVTQDDIVPRHE